MSGELKRLHQEVMYAIDGGCNPRDLQTALDLLDRAADFVETVYQSADPEGQAMYEAYQWLADYKAAIGYAPLNFSPDQIAPEDLYDELPDIVDGMP